MMDNVQFAWRSEGVNCVENTRRVIINSLAKLLRHDEKWHHTRGVTAQSSFVDHISIDFSSVYFEDFAPCALLYIYVCTFNAIWFLRRIYKRAAIEYSFSFISSSSLIYRSWRPIESLIIGKMEDGVVIFFLFLVLLNAMTRMKPWKV